MAQTAAGRQASAVSRASAVAAAPRVAAEDASGFVGRKGVTKVFDDGSSASYGGEIRIPRGTNAPGEVGGRPYSGHAFDQMPSLLQAAMITESARQVLASMRAALEAFEAGPSVDPLDRLVGMLSGSLDALVGQVDAQWLEEMRSAWWPLEFANASVLGDDRQTLKESEIVATSTARDEFLTLLAEPRDSP